MVTDGLGEKLTCKLGAGGFGGRATFIRTVTYTYGSASASCNVHTRGSKWVFSGEGPSQVAQPAAPFVCLPPMLPAARICR